MFSLVYFKILHLTDIHARRGIALEPLQKIIRDNQINLIVISGDLTHFGKKKDVRRVLDDFDQLGLPVFYVSGNCDPRDSTDITLTNIKPLEGQVELFKGVQFIGLGGSNKTPFRTPFELSEEEIKSKLVLLLQRTDVNKPTILVSHSPPLDSEADKLRNGTHVGSSSVKEFLEKEKISAILTGHIHESITVSLIGSTLCINPGPAFNEQAAIIEVQIYDDGTPFLKGEIIKY